VANGRLTLPPAPAGTLVSVFCHGSAARGVTLEGLSYPLSDAELTCDWPLGVSNAYEAERPEISVTDGVLLVIDGCSDGV
jgi:thiamine pyrophosphokinase